jgi:hypothetical protein
MRRATALESIVGCGSLGAAMGVGSERNLSNRFGSRFSAECSNRADVRLEMGAIAALKARSEL